MTEAANNLRKVTQDDSCGPSGCVNSFPTNPFVEDITNIFIQKMCLPTQAENQNLMNELIEVLHMMVTIAGYYGIWKPISLIADKLKFGKKDELSENQLEKDDSEQRSLERMESKNAEDLQRSEEERRWQAQGQGQLSRPSFHGAAANALVAFSGRNGTGYGNMSALSSAARMFATFEP